LLDYLFTFVQKDTEINLTLAGYFQKVVHSLYQKKETELIDYVYARQPILDNIVKKLYSKSLSDTLSDFICFESKNTKGDYLNERCSIISVMMK